MEGLKEWGREWEVWQSTVTWRGIEMEDRNVMTHIQELVDEEQQLYSKGHLTEKEKQRLDAIEVELDQYWDLLRQRRALRNAGKDPDDAELRGPDTVENYEQ